MVVFPSLVLRGTPAALRLHPLTGCDLACNLVRGQILVFWGIGSSCLISNEANPPIEGFDPGSVREFFSLICLLFA